MGHYYVIAKLDKLLRCKGTDIGHYYLFARLDKLLKCKGTDIGHYYVFARLDKLLKYKLKVLTWVIITSLLGLLSCSSVKVLT